MKLRIDFNGKDKINATIFLFKQQLKSSCVREIWNFLMMNEFQNWIEWSWQTPKVASGDQNSEKLFEMFGKFMNRNYFHITSMFTFYFVLFLRCPFIICFCGYRAHRPINCACACVILRDRLIGFVSRKWANCHRFFLGKRKILKNYRN